MSDLGRIRHLEAQLEQWQAIGREMLKRGVMTIHFEGVRASAPACRECHQIREHNADCPLGKMQALLEKGA